jgi:hypothetical protein
MSAGVDVKDKMAEGARNQGHTPSRGIIIYRPHGLVSLHYRGISSESVNNVPTLILMLKTVDNAKSV